MVIEAMILGGFMGKKKSKKRTEAHYKHVQQKYRCKVNKLFNKHADRWGSYSLKEELLLELKSLHIKYLSLILNEISLPFHNGNPRIFLPQKERKQLHDYVESIILERTLLGEKHEKPSNI